jgi:hypothetical protein
VSPLVFISFSQPFQTAIYVAMPSDVNNIQLKGTHARDFIVRFSPFYGIIQ